MASAHSYAGPMSLEHSRYATSSSSKVASPKTENEAAVNHQITAFDVALTARGANQRNADAQLAIAHGNALKDEVDKHVARFSAIVSSTVENTHRLLHLLRETTPSDATTATVDAIWKELNELYAAVNDAKAALPVFLDKQRNSMSLYHTAMLNELIQDTQDELNLQHKKVNLQHSLILEHQEAFKAYKEKTAEKLDSTESLQERVSRLTLEKGNLRTEIDKYTQLLAKERASKAEELDKADALQKKLEALMESKKPLLAELDTLRKQLDDRQEETKTAAQHEAEQRSIAELKLVNDKLAEETKRTAALQAMITSLSERERTANLDAEKAKKENKALNEKYNHQAAEHADAFTKLNELTKELDVLKTDNERLHKETTELQQRVVKLADVETQLGKLNQEKSDLTELANNLTSDLKAAKDEAAKAKTEHDELLKKIELLGKGDQVASAADRSALDQQAKKIAILETTLEEWTDLAKRSYNEYKSIVPTYNKAEQYRKDALEKDETIKDLHKKLAAATASQASDDGSYWKSKYESLLASIAA